jgi:transcriptional regulator with XRE-family HTH domain
MTQNDIAEIIGKKKMLISGVELGKNGSFLEEDLIKIADFMKLDENETRELMKEAAKSRDTIPKSMINYIYQNGEAYNLLYLLCKDKASKEQLRALLEFYRDSYVNHLQEVKNV